MNEFDFEVCSYCGLLYLREVARIQTWVCSCGNGGQITDIETARRRKAESPS